MDLVLGHHRDTTCLMALNYDELVSQGITLHKNGGEHVDILVVLFNHGPQLKNVKESLDDIPRNRDGWLLGSPGGILDRVQDIVCPGSSVNAHRCALDEAIPFLKPSEAPKSTRQKKPLITS